MATEGMVELLTREMAGCVPRRISDEEINGMVRAYLRKLGDLSDEQFAAVVDRWIDSQSDTSPAFKLPAVASLAELAKRHTTGTRAAGDRSKYIPPGEDFMESHRRFKVAMGLLNRTLLKSHDHRNGPTGCPVCSPAGDEMRDRKRELLEGLPAPAPEPETCCDGGWIDVEGGRVMPCEACNPHFEHWAKR